MACRTWDQYERYILQQWPLTRREVQVAVECIKGRKNKEIASVLGIGAETVNKTLDHVYRAIGVNGRDQLVAKLLIADIDNTPLQQSLILTGDAAALVGVGFMESLYESRGERKRPRSVRSPLSTKRNANGSKQSQSVSLNRVEPRPSLPTLEKSEGLQAKLKVTAESAEDLGWHISPESLMGSGALEG
ncbi:MAG TPA: helix-turn-helix transcriptional regulator [Blastocatellia bacterium]|nr:helix-turn-helix transcriptional regulator [Blastocatellia bacterium]